MSSSARKSKLPPVPSVKESRSFKWGVDGYVIWCGDVLEIKSCQRCRLGFMGAKDVLMVDMVVEWRMFFSNDGSWERSDSRCGRIVT